MPVTNIINERDIIASNDSGELFPDNTTSTVSSSTTENSVNASNDSGELFLDQSDSYVDQLSELFDGNDGEFVRSVSSGSVNDYKNYVAESFMDADGVLAKADVLMTPYGSSESVLNSVKPVEGTANFSFSRNSSATRVNELGYIEDVQVIGGELVSNGDFEEGGQDWGFETGWTMGDGVAIGTNAGTYLYQNVGAQANKKYRISWEIKNYVSGSVRPIINSGPNTVGTSVSGNGIYSEDLLASPSPNGNISIQGVAFYGEIDNISVKEVTDDTNLPRINYEGFTYENGLPVPYSGKGHLLLEGQRSNLFLYSEYINASVSSWSSFFDTIITNNDAISPEGVNNATKISCPIGGAARLDGIVSSLAAGTYTYSFYAKGDVSNLDVNVYQDATGTTLSTTAIETLINGSQWSRVTITFTSTALSTIRFIHLNMTAGEYFHLWGVMLESGDYATSYIPTNGTAVTRLGETCNNANHSFPSSGTLYAEIAALANDGTNRMISISDASDQNHIRMYYTNTSNRITFAIKVAGTNQVVFNYDGLDSVLDFHKVALRYQQDNTTLWVDGVQVDIDTSCNMPSSGALETLQFNAIGASNFYGKTKMVATFPYLSDDEMIKLTR